MTNNNNNIFNTTNNYNFFLPKQFLNYINYELSFFEKIAHKKFIFNISTNDRHELKVSKSIKEDGKQSKYKLLYGANNLYQFIKNLLMIRE